MMTFDDLIRDKQLQARIDWDLTPQAAYQMYQIKSINVWKYGFPADAHYVLIYVYQGSAKVMLVRRSVKETEELVQIPVPDALAAACLYAQGGDRAPVGQYAVDEPIRQWILDRFAGRTLEGAPAGS
jgi:hypothetical protein